MEIVSRLSQNGIDASLVGEMTEPGSGRILVTKEGKKIALVRPVSDHLWIALAEQSLRQGKR